MLDFELDMGELHHIWCLTTRNLFYGCWGGLLPRQGGVYLGLATLEKPLELSSHRDRQTE